MQRWAIAIAATVMVLGLVALIVGLRQLDGGGGQLEKAALRGLLPVGSPAPPEELMQGAPAITEEAPSDAGQAYGGEAPSATGGVSGEPVAPALPEVLGRKIIRNATVALEVEDVGAAVQRVENIAAAAGGFVANSSVFIEHEERPVPAPGEEQVQEPQEPTRTATLTLRVPATEYASVLSQLREMGEIVSESSSTGDVTEEFADLEARRRNLEATEQQYLRLLEQAKNINEILMLQDRINGVRLEIERIQGRLNLLTNLSDLATIEVQLRPLAAEEPAPSEEGWDPQEIADNAWEASLAVLRALGTAAIVGAVVVAWLAVPALVLLFVWRRFGMRPGGTP